MGLTDPTSDSSHDDSLKSAIEQDLAAACAKLDPVEEKALAEEGLEADLADWPEY